MSEIDKLKSAADILTQVDITDIITNMGLGIAQAQEKLDNNSIKQALALADPDSGFGGKSLLELGFVPAFYSFQYADVSAEIELKMRLATEFEVGGSLNFDFTKQGGFTKEKLNFVQKDRESKRRRAFKSSRSLVTKSSNELELTVLSNTVVMNEAQGSINRVETFARDIRSQADVERVSNEVNAEGYEATNVSASADVNIKNLNGYVVITIPPAAVTPDISILKVGDYNLPAADVDYKTGASPKALTIGGASANTFTKVFDAFGSSVTGSSYTLIGFDHANNKFRKKEVGGVALDISLDLELYFGFDEDQASIAFNEVLTDDDTPLEKDNTKVKDVFAILAKILAVDSSVKINISGYTDGSGPSDYNTDLSERRTKSLENWFIGKGANSDQITTSNNGETLAGADQTPNLEFRKVTVEITSNADFFYLKANSPVLSATVISDVALATPSSTINGIIYIIDASATVTPLAAATFEIGAETYSIDVNAATFAASMASNTALNEAFSYAIDDNTAYLLHNESSIRYTVYSATQEEIAMSIGSNESEDFESTSSSYLIDETTNTTSRIKSRSKNIDSQSTVAAGVSVDGRYSRKFSIDVSGNARVAARIVALPPPSQFIEEIKDVFNQ